MLFASDKEAIEYAQEVLLPAIVSHMPSCLVGELCWPHVSHSAALNLIETGLNNHAWAQ